MKKILWMLLAIATFIITDPGNGPDNFWWNLINGANGSVAAQSSGVVGPQNQSISPQGIWAGGGILGKGSIKTSGIGTPSAGTVVVNGTAGATTYTYACVAMDMNSSGTAASDFGDTIPSATFTTTTGNASLSATNFNTITCGGQGGALGYKILKTNTSTFLASCNTNTNFAAGVTTGTSCSVNDTGQATAAYVPNTSDQTAGNSTWVPMTQGAGLFANLPTCVLGIVGECFMITNSSAIAAEGQTCAGAGTASALACCMGPSGALIWKCF